MRLAEVNGELSNYLRGYAKKRHQLKEPMAITLEKINSDLHPRIKLDKKTAELRCTTFGLKLV